MSSNLKIALVSLLGYSLETTLDKKHNKQMKYKNNL